MPRSNLLCSNAGLELLPEVCLGVIEYLFVSDHKSIERLQLVSKSLRRLLKSHEISVTKAAAKKFHDLPFINCQQYITPSSYHLKNLTLSKYTFPWLIEMHHRKSILNFLTNHELTSMDETIHGWPALDDVNRHEKPDDLNINKFKTKAIGLLYGLTDCATGLITTKEIREEQSRFLKNLSVIDLASLGVMVEVIGHNFYNIAKRSRLKCGFISTSSAQRENNPPFESVYSTAHRRSNYTDEHWINEVMCVFEDLTQRFGPYFAWAYFEGPNEKVRQPDTWALEKLREGLDNMYAFELGYTMSYASLQSVVWRVFRRKVGCSSKESWMMAKLIVEKEMSSVVDGPHENMTAHSHQERGFQ
ncbi:hypothetical protein K3495_g13415 [Podosphaera aphanis]|nr:hypothetical protein K3495_g13415 [Podosphaera aphanis]